jgi:hypothetical protein
VLSLGGVPVTVGQHIIGSPADLTYESGVVLDGPGSDTFKFQVTDQGYAPLPALSSAITTAHIFISKAVNDGTYSFDAVGGIVRVGGTAAADDIVLDKGGGSKLRVRIGHSIFNTTIPLSSIHDIRIWGRSGNDHVHFGGGLDGVPLFVHAGAGNDSVEVDHLPAC